jgi:hypothetical protein
MLTSPSGGVVGNAYAAAVDKASQYLPTQLSARRRDSAPPPLVVAVRLRGGGDVHLPLSPNSTLEELRGECERLAGVPAASQRLLVEEEERPAGGGGLVSALRSTASRLTSRERLRDSLVGWVNFLFLPEAVNREVRGRGVASWAREHVWPRLAGPPPLHVARATVVLLGGRRVGVELSRTATLLRLREAAERATGLPRDRQRLVVAEVPPPGALAAAFWAAARVAFAVCCLLAGAVASGARWLVLGPQGDQRMRVRVRTGEGGREVDVAVRRDLTLGQLHHLVQLTHGDGAELHGLVVLGGGGAGLTAG